MSAHRYNRENAVLYAYEHWKDIPAPVLKDNGCTDFVSSCLHAGGILLTAEWKPYTYCWVNVNGFRNYLLRHQLASESSVPMDVEPGDVVQLQHKAVPKTSGRWGHTALITSVKMNGQILIACHSEARIDFPLEYYLIDSLWENPFGAFRFEKILW